MPRPATHVGSGKVRELYDVGDDRLVLVATDRISAYDVVLPQVIPNKGRVLTGLSAYWLEYFDDVPNHLISYRAADLPDVGMGDLRGRAMLVRKAEPLPVEFVVRGYLSGSGWREYIATGAVCGHSLPKGLTESDKLKEPLLTPATKAVAQAEQVVHDENITEEEAAGIVGEEAYRTARTYALGIYRRAARLAAERGVIIADTKFEFGLLDGHAGDVMLIDEVLTPDSSRFWPRADYEPGRSQPSFDKQFVRDYLEQIRWNKQPPVPTLPDDIIRRTREKYVEAYRLLAGRELQ